MAVTLFHLALHNLTLPHLTSLHSIPRHADLPLPSPFHPSPPALLPTLRLLVAFVGSMVASGAAVLLAGFIACGSWCRGRDAHAGQRQRQCLRRRLDRSGSPRANPPDRFLRKKHLWSGQSRVEREGSDRVEGRGPSTSENGSVSVSRGGHGPHRVRRYGNISDSRVVVHPAEIESKHPGVRFSAPIPIRNATRSRAPASSRLRSPARRIRP